jgi:dihydrofolate synthase/folylpolyglutamate synthase
MNYTQANTFYKNISTLGSKLGLDNMYNLLSKLNNPQNKLKVIHVAGTNGKGSVCAMLNSVLTYQNYTAGLYTSPYIVSYNQSIKINNTLISNTDFSYYTSIIRAKCNELVSEGMDHPTIFECLTALSLLYFHNNNVDFVILEVGLGGRLDATNIISNPLVSVITSISLDHTNYLGDSLDKIATEKAGIIKPNCPVALSVNDSIVVDTIKKYCNKQNAPLHYFNDSEININIINESKESICFNISTPSFSYNNINLSLKGYHQLYNTATVLNIIYILQNNDIKVSDSSIYLGLSNVQWECRMELLHINCDILIDGAHNAESINMLTSYINTHFKNTPITLIFGVLEDKEYDKMMKTLFPFVKTVILTKPLNDRDLSLTIAQETALKYCKDVIVYEDYENALDYGIKITKNNELLCCAGSLYLVGHIRNKLNKL